MLFSKWVEPVSCLKATAITRVKYQLDFVFTAYAISITLQVAKEISLGQLSKVRPHTETSLLPSHTNPLEKWKHQMEY